MAKLSQALAAIGLACAFQACALINLQQIELSLQPSENGQILGAGDEMSVGFSIAPNRDEAERLVSVSQGNNSCPGDYRWEGSRLFFKPVPPLTPGIRAILKVSGTLHSQDGRNFNLNQSRYFSVGPETPQTCLVSWSIAEETVSQGNRSLVLRFSRPMDQSSYLSGFRITPSIDLDRQWSPDGTELTLTPKKAWVNLTSYHWEVNPEFHDSNGQNLLEIVKHGFYVELDSIAPVINRLMVARSVPGGSGVSYLGISENLDSLKIGECLLVESSEALQADGLGSAFRLNPSIKGHWLPQSDGQVWQYIYVPDEAFLSGTRYQITIAPTLGDLSGNPIGTAISRYFTPAIPYIAISSIVMGDGNGNQLTLAPTDFTAIQTMVPSDPLNLITIRLELDLGPDGQNIEAADQAQFSTLPEFSHVFPNSATVREPALMSVSFLGGRSCLLSYAGFSKGDAASGPHYFRFRLPGGAGGIRLKSGQCLKEDLCLVIKTS